MEAENVQIRIALPCEFQAWDEMRNRWVPQYPAVNCGFSCDACGWNPEVARKRVQQQIGVRT